MWGLSVEPPGKIICLKAIKEKSCFSGEGGSHIFKHLQGQIITETEIFEEIY